MRVGADGLPKLGRFGVLLFFVHTALVLMSSIERQGTHRAGWVRAFYVRRALRIYPLAVVTILLVAACAVPVELLQPPVGPTAITVRTSPAISHSCRISIRASSKRGAWLVGPMKSPENR